MTPEILEQLMTDRALRALSPECESLLEEFLRQNPALIAEAEAIAEVVTLARRALEERPVRALPEFKVRDMNRIRWLRRTLRWGAVAAGMAACVALGYWVRPEGGPRKEGGTDQVAHVQPPEKLAAVPGVVAAGGAGAATVNEFWSVSRLQALAQKNEMSRRSTPERSDVAARFFKGIGG